ncbi:MAG: biotin/lipoyl-binding protein, partial [Chloroflexota bacterium]
MYRRHALWLLVLVLVAGCGQAGGAGKSATPASALPPVIAPTNVIAEGKLAPRLWVDLASQVGGRAVRVLVKEGDQVAAGALLVELDDAQQRAALAQAEAALAGAQADLARLMAGARPEEVAVAEAGVAAAKAGATVSQQQALAAGAAPALAAAQGAVARAQLADLTAGPRPIEIEVAER